jgi:hypothetical protein
LSNQLRSQAVTAPALARDRAARQLEAVDPASAGGADATALVAAQPEPTIAKLRTRLAAERINASRSRSAASSAAKLTRRGPRRRI